MKTIFLDRDGVINYDSFDYVKSPEECIFIPNSIEAIARLSQQGWQIIIITNQSGIGRGFYSEDTLSAIHQKIKNAVLEKHGSIKDIYFCPHMPDDNCECRKPKAGMLFQAAHDHAIDLKQSWFVGDSMRDVQAAQKAHCKPVLVKTGKELDMFQKHKEELKNISVFDDLHAFALWVEHANEQ